MGMSRSIVPHSFVPNSLAVIYMLILCTNSFLFTNSFFYVLTHFYVVKECI